jgi:hypothetical protein
MDSSQSLCQVIFLFFLKMENLILLGLNSYLLTMFCIKLFVYGKKLMISVGIVSVSNFLKTDLESPSSE